MYGAMIINENVNVGGLAGRFVLAGYNSILKDEFQHGWWCLE